MYSNFGSVYNIHRFCFLCLERVDTQIKSRLVVFFFLFFLQNETHVCSLADRLELVRLHPLGTSGAQTEVRTSHNSAASTGRFEESSFGTFSGIYCRAETTSIWLVFVFLTMTKDVKESEEAVDLWWALKEKTKLEVRNWLSVDSFGNGGHLPFKDGIVWLTFN